MGKDSAFTVGGVIDDSNSGYEMSRTLEKYLVGNDFIEHLAFYRLSEPDTIYVSSGQLSFKDFWQTYMGLDKETADGLISLIQNTSEVRFGYPPFDKLSKAYFSFIYPLPQLSKSPQAYVLMLIPRREMDSILLTQLANSDGEVAVYDGAGNEIYHVNNLNEEIKFDISAQSEETRFGLNGNDYILQTQTSPSNSWKYVSIVQLNNIMSEVVRKQFIFIILLILLMIIAVFSVLISIVVQYKPIDLFAMEFKKESDDDTGQSVIDEESLITGKLAALKGDSEQKKKF